MRTEETLPPRVLVGESSLGPVARWALDVKRRLARRNRHPRSLMNHAAAACSKVNRAPEYLTPCCSGGSQLVGDIHAVVHVAESHSGHSGPLWVSSPHPNRIALPRGIAVHSVFCHSVYLLSRSVQCQWLLLLLLHRSAEVGYRIAARQYRSSGDERAGSKRLASTAPERR